MSACPVCDCNRADLGRPSQARWVGPDGEVYCSIHFIQRFGHGEPLVRVEGYEPPSEPKPAARRRRRRKKEEVSG
jgi:hypothetical protein